MEIVLRKKICTGIAVVIITIVCLYLLQCLLVPKYASDIKEGAMIKEYYNSEKNHDVLILGDCEVYENISMVTMWENYGISSYIRGIASTLPDNSQEKPVASQQTESKYSFELKGIELKTDGDLTEYTSKLGEPSGGYYEAKSCAFEGMDKFYYYDMEVIIQKLKDSFCMNQVTPGFRSL